MTSIGIDALTILFCYNNSSTVHYNVYKTHYSCHYYVKHINHEKIFKTAFFEINAGMCELLFS